MHFEVASVWLAWPSRRGAFVIAWSRVYGCLCGAVARAKALCLERCGRLKTLISVYGLSARGAGLVGAELSLRLAAARKQAASREMLLWMTPSEAPKALQASECSELLDPMRASCWISAQH